jgi:hypothetical protein
MRVVKKLPRLRLLIAVASVLAFAGLTSSAALAANPGEVCEINRVTIVRVAPSYSAGEMYTLYPVYVVRIDHYAGAEWYEGHAEGKGEGYFPRVNINQSSCHST